jgi:hypothetical protein
MGDCCPEGAEGTEKSSHGDHGGTEGFFLTANRREAGLRFQEQVIAPVKYRDVVLPRAFKIDFVVEEELIVEVKAVERVLAPPSPPCPKNKVGILRSPVPPV